MTHDDLPPELASIERRLTGGPAPSAALRARVTGRVRDELRRGQGRPMGFWQYVGALAAAVLLLANLSLSVTSSSARVDLGGTDRPAELCEEIAEMGLDLPEAEVRRQCLLLAAGAELLPLARPQGSPGGLAAAWTR